MVNKNVLVDDSGTWETEDPAKKLAH